MLSIELMVYIQKLLYTFMVTSADSNQHSVLTCELSNRVEARRREDNNSLQTAKISTSAPQPPRPLRARPSSSFDRSGGDDRPVLRSGVSFMPGLGPSFSSLKSSYLPWLVRPGNALACAFLLTALPQTQYFYPPNHNAS